MISESTYQKFVRLHDTLSLAHLDRLRDIYSPHVIFEDPVRRIEGLPALEVYYRALLGRVSECRFEIYHQAIAMLHEYVHWNMRYTHPGLNRGKPVEVTGLSVLQGHDKIDYQRDYYDLGAMLYDQVPILGGVTRQIKRRLAP